MRILEPEVTKIQVLYDHPEQAHVKTLYEGIPLEKTIFLQAKAAGCELVSDKADGVLVIYTPPMRQRDQFLERVNETHSEDAFPQQPCLNLLKQMIAQGLPVALADVKEANGGDNELLSSLVREQLLFSLAGYTAWNTTGNTIGMAFAWLKAWIKAKNTPESHLAQIQFLLERYLDDGLYQGWLRQQLCQSYDQPVSIQHCLSSVVCLNDQLKQWQDQALKVEIEQMEVEQFTFPWERFFEAAIAVKLHMIRS
jgi:hypothetical protein